MTQDELVLLEKGRIPAAPILDRLVRHVSLYDSTRNPEETGELTLVCERAGLDYSTIARNVYRHTHEGDIRSLDFDTADKLLCCGMKRRWSEDETLAEYYERVDLSWYKCACPGCETMFHRDHEHAGATARKYCSASCRHAARNQRIGRTHRVVKKHRGAMADAGVCRNGHPRTPENTVLRKNGKRECRICKREANNDSYARREQAKRMARVRQCEHPECNVAFAPKRTDQRFCSQQCRDGMRKFRVTKVPVAAAA